MERCASGWTKECLDGLEHTKDIWDSHDPEKRNSGLPGRDYWFLPKNWDSRDEIDDGYRKYVVGPSAREHQYETFSALYFANSVLLGFAVIGVVFVVLRLINGDSKSGNNTSSPWLNYSLLQ
jgi:hypothetical protein